MRSWLIGWLPVVVWLAIIACESTESMGAGHTVMMLNAVLGWLHFSVSWQTLETVNHLLRKTGHFVGYGILGALFIRAWALALRARQHSGSVLKKALLLGITCTLLVACLDEFHQAFLPGRTSSAWDVALDTLGACVLAFLFLRPIRRLATASS